MCVCVCVHVLWRVGCLPPNYQHLPVPYSPPFTRLPTGVGVWERRGAETARSGGVWWGTHLKWMEPHHRRCYMPSAPLLWRPVSSPCMHAGVLVGPGRERWGSNCRTRTRLTGQDAGPFNPREVPRAQRRTKPPIEAAAPRAPDLRGERVRPPDSAPYLDPSFQNTAPPSQPAQHNEDTRSPVSFGHFIPFGHFILLFLFNKSLSEAWRHAHCVCRWLLLPQWWRMRARRSLDSAVGQHRWRHPLSLAEVRENPHWDGGTTETASQPPKG